MLKADRISGAFWLCFSVLAITLSYRLGLGTVYAPGPGFLFFWANIVLAAMSLTVIVRTWANHAREEDPSSIFGGAKLSKVAVVLLALFFYALLMETLGFILATLAFFLFLLGVVEKKRWGFTILVSVAVTGIAYCIFEIWLHSMLPAGLLAFLRY